MNAFSFLPTTSLSLRPSYFFGGDVASAAPTSLVWKNSAFKNGTIPLDFTDVLLRNGQTSTPNISEDTTGKEWNVPMSSLSRPSLLNHLPLSMITSGAVTELHRQGALISKPNLYRKYQFLDRQHRHSESSSNIQCYVNPPECLDHSSCPSGNELASLKALCDTDVSVLLTKRPIGGSLQTKIDDGKEIDDGRQKLKFGIERILSDTFGQSKTQDSGNENITTRGVCGLYPSKHAPCQCSPPSKQQQQQQQQQQQHHYRDNNLIVYSPNHLPSLSACQAIHTPRYPFNTSVDSLPGPYSVLSTDPYNTTQHKRKRSWSRAVFSNLQRKGLEKRFEVQKYVTKLDRRQLASMLGLTDAQVKVWFQNRRMKWRHAQQQKGKDKESKEEQEMNVLDASETKTPEDNDSNGSELSNDDKDVVIDDCDEISESSS